MRAVSERNDKVTEDIKLTSQKLLAIEPKYVAETHKLARLWSNNAAELKASLDEQIRLTAEMRDIAKDKDQEQAVAFASKFRLLEKNLEADVKKLFGALDDYVDMPQDFQRSTRTWDAVAHDLEMDLKGLSAVNAGKDLQSLDPIAQMLNYRDELAALLLRSLLFKKAVLDWDMKCERSYADGPMVAMAEMAVNIFSRSDSLPFRYRPWSLPLISEKGPFTLPQKQDVKGQKEAWAGVPSLTPIQSHLLAVLREMKFMDKALRNVVDGEKVLLNVSERKSGQNPAAEEFRNEMVKWYDKCEQLEKELKSNKAEAEVDNKQKTLDDKERANKARIKEVHKLEGDIQSLKYELEAFQRQRDELSEQNTKIAKESLPMIDKLNQMTSKSHEAMERLLKDADLLSKAFRHQVEEGKRIKSDSEDIARNLAKVQDELQEVRQKNAIKETQIQKKETVYLRTMAARKSIQDSFKEQRDRVAQVEEAMQQRELDRQELLKVLEGKDSEISQLKDDLARAHHRIDELKQQREMAAKDFRAKTGRRLMMD